MAIMQKDKKRQRNIFSLTKLKISFEGKDCCLPKSTCRMGFYCLWITSGEKEGQETEVLFSGSHYKIVPVQTAGYTHQNRKSRCKKDPHTQSIN